MSSSPCLARSPYVALLIQYNTDRISHTYLQPTCHQSHLPPYLEKLEQFKAKGVDVLAVFAANDPFVMSGWAKVTGLKDKVHLTLFRSSIVTLLSPSSSFLSISHLLFPFFT